MGNQAVGQEELTLLDKIKKFLPERIDVRPGCMS